MTLTLPARAYVEPSTYERERHAIWAREWLLVAPATELEGRGAYVAAEIAGWPVFVVRTPAGELKGFHNVCAHRAGVLVWPGTGVTGNIVCRYHGWAYDWDGGLARARDFGSETGLCVDDQRLVPIQVESWRGLVWANLDLSVPSLVDALGGPADDHAASAREAMVEMSNVLLDEDQAICEAVQRNLEAGVYQRGNISPKHEGAVAWFQRRVAVAVGET